MLTVLRLDRWAGRVSLYYQYRKNGKQYRDAHRWEKIACGAFNYCVCLICGHEKCNIKGCNCGTCFHCGMKMEGR